MGIGERTKLISYDELNNADLARVAWWTKMQPIMLFPENPSEQELYKYGVVDLVFRQITEEDQQLRIREETPKHCAFMSLHEKKVAGILYKTSWARKNGMLGALAIRGVLSGQILTRLANPDIGTLDKAYDRIIEQYKENGRNVTDFANQHFPGEGLATPSKSLLKKVWNEFKNVAHFWAAESLMNDELQVFSIADLGQPCPENAHQVLHRFLGVATFFRNKLIESVNPSTKTPHIKEAKLGLVWSALTEEGRETPPLTCSLR
jgi:hypothetical protein